MKVFLKKCWDFINKLFRGSFWKSTWFYGTLIGISYFFVRLFGSGINSVKEKQKERDTVIGYKEKLSKDNITESEHQQSVIDKQIKDLEGSSVLIKEHIGVVVDNMKEKIIEDSKDINITNIDKTIDDNWEKL